MRKLTPGGRRIVMAGLVLAGLVALYAALGFLAVPRLVTSLAKDIVKEDYGRELALGEVRFNPFTLALEARDLALPDAEGSLLIGFDRLLVDLQVNSIWRRALSFRAIALDGLAVNAIVREGGALNLADLVPPADADPPPEAAEPLPRLAIGELNVEQGRIHFEDRDRPEPYVADLAPLTFRLTDFTTYIKEGDRYELDATLFDSSRFTWRGTLLAQPLTSEGEFRLTGLPLPRLAECLGDALRLEVTRGTASLDGSYRFAEAPDGLDVVVSNGQLTVREVAIRDRGEETEYLALDDITAKGIAVSLADEKASIAEIALTGGRVQTWITPEGEFKRSGIFDPMVTVEVDEAGEAAPDAATDEGADSGWQVSIPRITVQKLAVGLEDQSLSPAPSIVLDPLDVTIEGYHTVPGTTVRIALDGTVNGKGQLAVAATTDMDTLGVTADVELSGFELPFAQPYIAQQASLTLTDGVLAAKGKLTYEDTVPEAKLGFAGDISVERLRTVDDVLREDFIRWDALHLGGVEYRSAPENLRIRAVDARGPYARVIIGPDGTTNIAAILAGPGAGAAPVAGPTVGPAESREAVADEGAVAVIRSPAEKAGQGAALPIRIGTVKISGGSANFADFTTRPNFAIGIEKLAGTIAGLSSSPDTRAKVDLKGQVDQFSPVTIGGGINPLAAETFLDMAMSFSNVELASFTPYSGRFAGYSIRQGKLSADLNYKVVDRQLEADHEFVIDQLELGDKVESPDSVGLPLKLAVALLKDRNGVIDLDLPVTGDLDNPEFRIGPIVWKALVNLLTKAVTAPFALLGSLVGGGEELNLLAFRPGDAEVGPAGQEKVATLVKALAERPGIRLSVPAVFNRAADAPALKQAVLEQKLVAAGKEGETIEALRAEPRDYLRRLKDVWRQEAGRDVPMPEPPPDSTDPEAEARVLEDALVARVEVGEAEFFALAKARAVAVQTALLAETGIDPGRVFLTSPVEGKAAADGVVMELALE